MERNLHNEDFEEFLKLKTDHYKLYPSDKVWKGVYKSLHTRKRWFQVGGSFLFLSALLFINYEFNNKKPAPAPQQVNATAKATVPETQKTTVPVTQNSIPKVIIASSVTKVTLPAKRKNNLSPLDASLFAENSATPAPVETSRAADVAQQDIGITNGNTEMESTSETVAGLRSDETMSNEVADATHHPDAVNNAGAAVIKVSNEERVNPDINHRSSHEGADVNWLQEMAAMKLASTKRNRFNLQFYFSPTVSYRKLTDGEKSKDLSNVPLATNQLGLTSFVDHKPSIGLELGSNLLFSPSKKLTLKTGLQLNYSRYSIKAYKFYYEKAKIELLTAGRISDTMSSYTSIRNFNGYSPEQLENQYIQLSMPIGAEYKLLGGKRLQLTVAGTIQPTYLLYNDTYLLSTDFINYTKEPSLIRRWNVNTSAEAYVSYYIGSMRWQIGPQFRYQSLSSYVDRYPIKEYLFEYGVKIGVSKTLR
jgi:hypothetical protein